MNRKIISTRGLERQTSLILTHWFFFAIQVGKHLDLSRLMKSWTEEKSFPIVTLKHLKGPEKDLILAKQESFLEHKLALTNDKLLTETFRNKSTNHNDEKERQKASSR